jgi:hypothetical protein
MRKILIAVACVAFAAAVWAANDPWKDKPYQQWDSKDLQVIFQNSPWSHVVRVDAPWVKSGGGGNPGVGTAPGGGESAPSGGTASGGKMGAGGYGSPGGGNSASAPTVAAGSDTGSPQAVFVVRWISSRTFREAMVRDRVLRGQMTEADAQADLAKPVEGIELAVLGPDMTPFESMDENALKNAASLVEKHSKTKLAPSEVRIQKTQDGSKVAGVLFVFPSKAENGEAIIPSDEKSVEFALTAGKFTLKSAFEISKMADSQGRDL